MRVELRAGQTADVAGSSIVIKELRATSVANSEGKLETRRAALLVVGGKDVEVVEGSALIVGSHFLVVTRVSKSKGLVRMRTTSEGRGRFEPMVEGFLAGAGPFDEAMTFAIEGARLVNDAIGRLDDHPDTVGSFSEPLGKAQKYLQHARGLLASAGRAEALLSSVDGYLGLCAPLLDAVLSATQEREVQD